MYCKFLELGFFLSSSAWFWNVFVLIIAPIFLHFNRCKRVWCIILATATPKLVYSDKKRRKRKQFHFCCTVRKQVLPDLHTLKMVFLKHLQCLGSIMHRYNILWYGLKSWFLTPNRYMLAGNSLQNKRGKIGISPGSSCYVWLDSWCGRSAGLVKFQ